MYYLHLIEAIFCEIPLPHFLYGVSAQFSMPLDNYFIISLRISQKKCTHGLIGGTLISKAAFLHGFRATRGTLVREI